MLAMTPANPKRPSLAGQPSSLRWDSEEHPRISRLSLPLIFFLGLTETGDRSVPRRTWRASPWGLVCPPYECGPWEGSPFVPGGAAQDTADRLWKTPSPYRQVTSARAAAWRVCAPRPPELSAHEDENQVACHATIPSKNQTGEMAAVRLQ